MDIESIRIYCVSKKAVTECMPFDDKTLVFKVAGKIFALAALDVYPLRLNLKCDPEKAVELREQFNGIKPGYHMNKNHWNSVYLNEDVQDEMIYQLIDDSYNLIVKSLTKKLQQELINL